jgi:hypothetical protein
MPTATSYPDHAELQETNATRRNLHLKLLVGGHLLPLPSSLDLRGAGMAKEGRVLKRRRRREEDCAICKPAFLRTSRMAEMMVELPLICGT